MEQPGSSEPLIMHRAKINHDGRDDAKLGPATARGISFREKLGAWAVAVFSIGPMFMLAAMGMLSFLWFGDPTNSLWRSMVNSNWATTTVAICSEVLKQTMSFQLGLIAAMLAAMALERFEVLLPEMASVTMTRAAPDASRTMILLWQYLTSFWYAGNLISHVGTWSRGPAFYPTFAEYSEPPFEAEGVVDTGLTLRAFIPFRATQDRETLRSYSSYTTIMDARVTCQVPAFINLTADTSLSRSDNVVFINGSVTTPRFTPRMGNSTLRYDGRNQTDRPRPFDCLAGLHGRLESGDNEWAISVCQLGWGGTVGDYVAGLANEFHDMATWLDDLGDIEWRQYTPLYGTAYLVLNMTRERDWYRRDSVVGAEVPVAQQARNEWLDMSFPSERNPNNTFTLSATICHSAFGFSEQPVNITSGHTRTEPQPEFDLDQRRFTFETVRRQLGQNKTSQSPSDRGIFELEKKTSWVAHGSSGWYRYIEPYQRGLADMGLGNDKLFNLTRFAGNAANVTGLLFSQGLCPERRRPDSVPTPDTCFSGIDSVHIWLFQEMLRTGSSMAFALQSMQTILGGMAYYDQLGQFDNTTESTHVFFETASAPVRRGGFFAVAGAVAAHLALAAAVLGLFLAGTSFSRIGATWAAIGQLSAGDTGRYLAIARGWRDGRVEKAMADDGVRNLRAGLAMDRDGEVIAVTTANRIVGPGQGKHGQIVRKRQSG
ncbi:hypothetical protein OQA88_643 [Cercophora sp. LCS_1]